MKDRRFAAALAVAAASAVALVFLPSWPALIAAGALGLALAGLFARWIRTDAADAGQDAALWPWAMLLWPLALPPYLILTRGMRGLLLAAGVLFLFFLLPFAFLGAIVRQDYAAGRLIDEAQSLSWKADTGEDPKGKEKALALFERAIATDPNAWQAYMRVFATAFELNRAELAKKYYERLLALRSGSWRRTASDGSLIGWYLTALNYQDFAQESRLEEAMRALAAGDTRRLVVESRAALRHREETVSLLKDWDRLHASLGERQRKEYAEDLAKAREFIAYLKREGWKSERAGALADKIDGEESWRLAIESYGQGLIAGSARRMDEALERFGDAARRRPDFAEPELMRASILLDRKRYADVAAAARGARERIERGGLALFQARRESQLAIGHALEGFALLGAGKSGAARSALARALELDADNEAAQALKKKLEADGDES